MTNVLCRLLAIEPWEYGLDIQSEPTRQLEACGVSNWPLPVPSQMDNSLANPRHDRELLHRLWTIRGYPLLNYSAVYLAIHTHILFNKNG